MERGSPLIAFLKFNINSVEGLFGDLKTFLSLPMPNQYCLDVRN